MFSLPSLFPDIFSQISDSSGIMVHSQFDQFLREVLKLPMAVFEGPSFGYTEQAARTCFAQQVRVSLTTVWPLITWRNLTVLCTDVNRKRSPSTHSWTR